MFFVRWFILKLCNNDPIHESADQKGFHMNEAGSKLLKTLDCRGTDQVKLVEDLTQQAEAA